MIMTITIVLRITSPQLYIIIIATSTQLGMWQHYKKQIKLFKYIASKIILNGLSPQISDNI